MPICGLVDIEFTEKTIKAETLKNYATKLLMQGFGCMLQIAPHILKN